jgi:hypothetical protein
VKENMVNINRRRFLRGLATGAGAAVSATAYGQQPSAPPSAPMVKTATPSLGMLATTADQPLLGRPDFFEDLLGAPLYDGEVARNRVPLRMTIRGLCAVVIRQNFIDIVLMDSRAHANHHPSTFPAHVGKFTVDERYADVAAGSTDVRVTGLVEKDHPEYFPIRAWDVRGSIVTFSSQSPWSAADRIRVVDQSATNPWASMKWQLNFDDVFPSGTPYSQAEMEATAKGAIAGIIRLEYGRLQSALPGRRYGNTGVWQMIQAGRLDEPRTWRQALSDTLLYSLDLPEGDTRVTLTRRPLTGYVPAANEPAPGYAPIVLRAPVTPGEPLPCGLSHEPPLGAAQHRTDLSHNDMFYHLYTNAPTDPQYRPVPQLVSHWADVGVGRESRSAYWKVTRNTSNPNPNAMAVNICDPNCNAAVIGLNKPLA